MSYLASFHRLVLGGTLYSERWNTSLSIVGSNLPDVSQSMLDAVATAVSSWFSSGGPTSPGFLTVSKLTEVKLNRIGTDGKYRDPTARTKVYGSPVSGPQAGDCAPQLSCVVTLRTAFERGPANRGRMFLPPTSGYTAPGSDGRATVANAQNKAGGVATLINSLRAVYVAQYGPGDDTGHVAVVSDRGAGAENWVTYTEAGRVIDTMRSRRTSLVEDRQISTIAITP